MMPKNFQMNIGKDVKKAVDILRAGGTVAFPTETVYGLGADASNPQAVKRIFAIKGRPTEHPLIVHIGHAEQLDKWAVNIPPTTRCLTKHFWPGPLTIILQKADWVPEVVTGGLTTIGLRIPSHPLALSLLKSFEGGIAAPSANRFGRVSPTTADHVYEELGCDIDFILNGGSCSVGIESTIIDLSSGHPEILRPGGVTRESLEQALGEPVKYGHNSTVRCPGQHLTHYAPKAQVVLANESNVFEIAKRFLSKKFCVGIMSPKKLFNGSQDIKFIDFPYHPKDQAQQLYAKLRLADSLNLDVLVVVLPISSGLGVAIMDRLSRAASQGGGQKREGVL